MQLGDATEGRVHWHVNYNLPEVEGSFGADSRERSQEMHAEVGYAHAEVSKLELVVWPARNNPKICGIAQDDRNTSTSSSSSGAHNGDGEASKEGKTGQIVENKAVAVGNSDTAEDWVGKGLSDLQMHVGELQNWWQTTKTHFKESTAAVSAPPPPPPSQ